MRISPSADEMTTPSKNLLTLTGMPTTVYSTDWMRILPSTDEFTTRSNNLLSTTVMSTTDTSDRSTTTLYSTDGMRMLPSSDEMTTRSNNLLSATVMPTSGEIIELEIELEGINSTWMPSTDEMRLFASTVDTSTKTTTTSTIGLSTTRMPTTESCPNNMIWMNCSCQTTCYDPEGLHGCFKSCDDEPGFTCVCPDGFLIKDGACIPLNECGCYHSPTGVI
ncbi:uncharacterized protein [Apostichopus japonicus]|uniref:uncharacterized protein n=1 Tax=Stichopus japonicus TaxID=307972 RepID=UPI003AB215EB